MAKDVGTAIHKSIVVSFLPCLVAFLGFHPYMVPHFFKTVFCNFLVVTLRYHTKATVFFAWAVYIYYTGNMQLFLTCMQTLCYGSGINKVASTQAAGDVLVYVPHLH